MTDTTKTCPDCGISEQHWRCIHCGGTAAGGGCHRLCGSAPASVSCAYDDTDRA